MSRHHYHHEPPPPACCSCGCFCACSAPAPCSGGGGYYPVPAQPAPASDQLLHAIAAHLLLNSAPPPPPQPQPHPQQPPPQPPAAHHANLHSSYAYQYQQQQQGPNTHAYPHPPPPPQHQQQAHQAQPPPPQHQQQGLYPQPPAPPQHQPYQPDHGQLLLHSLLRRVAALETSLPHSYLPSPPQIPHPHRRHHRAPAHQEEEESDDPPSPPPRRARGGRRPPPPSERELAARTIQEHFRRFLARRSRTLRQLKELAILRSKAASLRGSISGSDRRRCKDPVVVSEAAMGLLLHLDGIQGGDPMIREGKRAVSRELSRILEFVDKVLVKDHEEMALDNAEYPEGCHSAPVVNRPTANKKVSFRCSEAAQNEEDESSESSSSAEADERKGANSKSIANGKPGLAAPAPVQMESRRAAGEMR
ncbi:hypothetical protein QYE76_014888 [Lolium multiflorum]|uniref:BAG domain-containing protein n=1 Tax=Lolium multiflorum TaxID=4521 RepID=A0AAD8X684_LOLMU|nr:hypothetical protein QYE76_014888 [Lolium multiflorum]